MIRIKENAKPQGQFDNEIAEIENGGGKSK